MQKFSKKKLNTKGTEINKAAGKTRIYTNPFFAAGILLLAIAFYCSRELFAYDTDMNYMIATGREILKNGIPYINPFTWLKGLKIIIQNWAYCIEVYGLYKALGKYAGYAITILNLSILFAGLYKTARLKNDQAKSFFISCLLIFCSMYFWGPRASLLTVGLLVWQLYICEAKKSEWWLPLLVLIESNFHASYIIFHFAYLLPYMVPGITKFLKDESNFKKYIKVIPAMIIAAIANPYGVKGALYLYYSYGEVTKLPIWELEVFSYNEPKNFIPIIVGVIILIFVVIKTTKGVPSPAFYVVAGTVALLCIFPLKKNVFFITVGFLPILSYIMKDISIKGKKYWPESIIATIIMIVAIVNSVPVASQNVFDAYPDEIISYLREVKPKRMYTEFYTGSFAELAGIKCFVDSRPELYMKKLNGKADYVYYDYSAKSKNKKEWQEVINHFNFDYILVKDDADAIELNELNKNLELIKKEKILLLYKNKSYKKSKT